MVDDPRATEAQPFRPQSASIAIVGCGLIGASIAKALAEHGCIIFVSDINGMHTDAVAGDILATKWTGQEVDVVVVATPPDAVAQAVLSSHAICPTAAITDVGSIKVQVMDAVMSTSAAARFVGGHPIAGATDTGPAAAHAEMFSGKPWVVVPGAASDDDAVAWAHAIARWCGASPVQMSADEHDHVLALTSHLPQVVSSAVAAALLKLRPEHVHISGSGLESVTRLSASNPELWTQILQANAVNIAAALHQIGHELAAIALALECSDAAAVTEFMKRGNEGRRLLG